MKQRIGVYICHCGGNISDYVDVEQISKLLQNEEGVVLAKDVMFACADSNQKDMISDIKEQNLDAIVVASCSPKLHLHTFRNVAERAGINPYNYVQVNIREQCSWPHFDEPLQATHKAIGLIRAGIGRVAYSEALENIEITAEKAVMVLGAGIAGLRASIDLARTGNHVYLIEKDFFVGGKVVQLGNVFPTNEPGPGLIKRLYDEIKKYNNITLFTGATLGKMTGSLGNFTTEIIIKPRGIKQNFDTVLLQQALDECPSTIRDEFNFGHTSHKAIYKSYPGAYPDTPFANIDLLKDKCDYLEKYASVIDTTQQTELLKINIGAVLVSTGFETYEPKPDEYAYQTNENVITLNEFTRIIELNAGELKYMNHSVKNVTFIYCVGNRQKKGDNKYCSRYCCTAAINTSLQLKEKYKNIISYHLFRDIRTYGKQEVLYEKSSKLGDIYIRFDEKEPPVVEKSGNKTIVRVKDLLTSKKELEIETDLVVLVTGMIARPDSTDISDVLKIPIGRDRFFNEIHPKLKPVETVIKGVYIGGACQGPKNISESVQSSLNAAAKISALLSGGNIALEPIIANIDAELCTWCGKCSAVCEYDAIQSIEVDGKTIASVNIASCKGCGICAPVCPDNAINIAQYTDHEIEAMIDGFMKEAEVLPSGDKEDADTGEHKVGMKEFPQLWKNIETALISGPKTIPQLAVELSEKSEIVTYHLMTMNKYNLIEATGLDDKETYFLYKMKN